MTVIDEREKTCGLCGEVSQQLVVLSTYIAGSSQLDTRPGALGGLEESIQRCPSCGYCAYDISHIFRTRGWVKRQEERLEKNRIVQSGPYQEQLHNRDFPDVANSFLCASLISENTGEYASAGFECMQAAWVCDDREHDAAARDCRRRAVDLLLKGQERRQRLARQRGGQETLLTDLLRRSAHFELARVFCKAGLKRKPKGTLSDVLRFEMMLIDRADAAGHNVTEAQKALGGTEGDDLPLKVGRRSRTAGSGPLVGSGEVVEGRSRPL